jgi:hypothetical protein
LAQVTELLKNGGNVDETDRTGNTPLHYAVRRGHLEVARLLLDQGANINLFDASGMTAKSDFDLMACSGNPMQAQMDWGVSEEEGKRLTAAFKELFAKYPTDPNYRDGQGRTLLHQMASAENTMIDLVVGDKPLLLAVTSPKASDMSTRVSTPVDDKSSQPKMKDWNAAAYIADLLIKAGAKLDLKMPNGQTQGELAMAAAVKAKNPQLISVLHDAGIAESGAPATTTQTASHGADPALARALVAAAGQGNVAEVVRLLKQGADPNASPASDGNSALFAAVENNHIDVVKALLDAGASANLYTGVDTPLIHAADAETVRLLVQHGANVKPKLRGDISLLGYAVGRDQNDRGDVIAELIKQGADFTPNGNGPELLVEAAEHGKINIVRVLLDAGVSPDACSHNFYQRQSALVAATLSPTPDVLKLLLARGANPDKAQGYTSPLGTAVDAAQWNNVAVLRQAGESDVGMLSEACARGDLAKAAQLINMGATSTKPTGAARRPFSSPFAGVIRKSRGSFSSTEPTLINSLRSGKRRTGNFGI